MVHSVVPVINEYRITDNLCTFRIHPAYHHNTVHLRATAGPGMYQINLSVLIPQRRRVYHSFTGFHKYGFLPFAGRVFCLYHEDAEIRVAPIDVKFPFMVTYGRSPHSLTVAGGIIKLFRLQLLQGIIDNTPIHQILGMENRQPRRTSEAGSGHIKIITGRTDIRVGVIGMQYRISISTVTLIRHPYLGYVLRFRLQTDGT